MKKLRIKKIWWASQKSTGIVGIQNKISKIAKLCSLLHFIGFTEYLVFQSAGEDKRHTTRIQISFFLFYFLLFKSNELFFPLSH